jgi:hypothetical protein
MDLKAFVENTNKRDKTTKDEYGIAINEYEMWIIDEYLKALNEKAETESFIRNIIYSFIALRESYKN